VMELLKRRISEPYRWFFPVGIILLIAGAGVWIPLLWNQDSYPILIHRFLMLNGFTSFFIAGFLMTAIPRFSGAGNAQLFEILIFNIVTLIGLIISISGNESYVSFISALQALLILLFIGRRILKRKQNPPFSFIFIFVGLILWLFSGIYTGITGSDLLKSLHYEGAIAAIIIGVGSRLIPGILGHVDIVQMQRSAYEKPVPIYRTIPVSFVLLILGFILSYFMIELSGYFRAGIVAWIAIVYWKIFSLPKERTSLTWSIWISAWLIVLSFIFRAFAREGEIHVSHAFFLGGIVLLSLMIATRVIQSHGPKDKNLENIKLLYVVTGLIVISMLTRVSAFYLPEQYLSHLSYGAFVLILAVIIWAVRFLKYVRIR